MRLVQDEKVPANVLQWPEGLGPLDEVGGIVLRIFEDDDITAPGLPEAPRLLGLNGQRARAGEIGSGDEGRARGERVGRVPLSREYVCLGTEAREADPGFGPRKAAVKIIKAATV